MRATLIVENIRCPHCSKQQETTVKVSFIKPECKQYQQQTDTTTIDCDGCKKKIAIKGLFSVELF